MQDHMVRLLSSDGTLRGAAAITTNLVEAMRRRQGTDFTAAVALGRLVTGAALLGSTLKGDQRLALTVEGNGTLGKMHAETDAAGHVRATVRNPVAGLPLKDGRFDVVGAVGRAGLLRVTKDLGLKEPYRGLVELRTSEIAEDIAWYLTTSEQIPSTVALGVYIESSGEVSSAGGFLIQKLPGGEDHLVPLLEKRLAALAPVTTLLREGLTPLDILERLFSGIPFNLQGEIPLEFRCTCSRRQVLGVLQSLGAEELRHLQEREEETTVTCEFCKTVYRFSRRELAGIED